MSRLREMKQGFLGKDGSTQQRTDPIGVTSVTTEFTWESIMRSTFSDLRSLEASVSAFNPVDLFVENTSDDDEYLEPYRISTTESTNSNIQKGSQTRETKRGRSNCNRNNSSAYSSPKKLLDHLLFQKSPDDDHKKDIQQRLRSQSIFSSKKGISLEKHKLRRDSFSGSTTTSNSGSLLLPSESNNSSELMNDFYGTKSCLSAGKTFKISIPQTQKSAYYPLPEQSKSPALNYSGKKLNEKKITARSKEFNPLDYTPITARQQLIVSTQRSRIDEIHSLSRDRTNKAVEGCLSRSTIFDKYSHQNRSISLHQSHFESMPSRNNISESFSLLS